MTGLELAITIAVAAIACYLSYITGWQRGWRARAQAQRRANPNVETMMAVTDAIQRMYTWKHGDSR